MTDKIEKNPKKESKDDREARLSAALRANLRRRKAAKKNSSRIQQESSDTSGDKVE
ncbi:hypothetical protein [Hirschia litorea]|uniref:Uncharacterized protein n=1 Tax=Hirschia litorea TaxID=1199156 RepID=A0ABW2IHI7_9PROT